MGVMDDAERIEPGSAKEWGEWLRTHHATVRGVWLVNRRRAAERALGYEESVLEALRFGWVDSTQKTLDEQRSMMWFAPRRPDSLWTRPNKERIARLSAEGRLEPAGLAAVERAQANGNWTLLDPVEDLAVPGDLAAALDALPGAREHWDAFPPSAQKAALTWIVTAKRPATRAARVAEIAQRSARGTRPR